MDVSDPAEDDGGAVQDAALWLHLQAAAVVTRHKLTPVNLREKHEIYSGQVCGQVRTNQKQRQSASGSGSSCLFCDT